MDWMTLILFVLGLGLLIAGAELLVRGASRLASAVGISPLVIGLTVVAFGTSSPEMAVSVSAAVTGQADLAVGNVVGSNILNVLFILGLSAAITPLLVQSQLIRFDVPIMIGVSVLMLLMGIDGFIGRLDGLLLLAGIALYTAVLIRQSRKESAAVQTEYDAEFGRQKLGTRAIAINLLFVAAGLATLVLGSRWLVDGAVTFARFLGVDEIVIGLTIVAAGTSLPEVAASIVAAIKGERDIAVGNVVGSNIFNILAVLGLSGLVSPSGIPLPPSVLAFDAPVMLAVAVACLPLFFTGREIARWEGFVFLGYYVAYTAYLILNATAHSALPVFSMVMVTFVLPLTVLTLAVVLVRELRKTRSASAGRLT